MKMDDWKASVRSDGQWRNPLLLINNRLIKCSALLLFHEEIKNINLSAAKLICFEVIKQNK